MQLRPNMLKRRLHQLFLCSTLLLRKMLSLNPAMWEEVLIWIARRFVEVFFDDIVQCLQSNYTALGWLITKEVS